MAFSAHFDAFSLTLESVLNNCKVSNTFICRPTLHLQEVRKIGRGRTFQITESVESVFLCTTQ